MIKKSDLFKKLITDEYRYYVQMILVPLCLGVISFGMFLINIFTNKTGLMYATIIFSSVSFLNAGIAIYKKNATWFNHALFFISVISLFTYFMVTGGTAEFSPIWICVLPLYGEFFMGKKNGLITCIVMFVIIVFLLWIPFGYQFVTCNYSPEFRMRFPLVYLSFFVLGLIFEQIRSENNKELVELQKKYRNLSYMDSLTEIHNRRWFNEIVAQDASHFKGSGGLIMADIDDFKKLNDKYGHLFGDKVLKAISEEFSKTVGKNGAVCRWGGEEFFGIVYDCNQIKLNEICEECRKNIEKLIITDDDTGIDVCCTISIGNVWVSYLYGCNIDKMTDAADDTLYKAKDAGKNCVRTTVFSE